MDGINKINTAPGASLLDMMPSHIAEKIWPEPMSGCWLWGAATNNFGYGQIRISGRTVYAHRYMWQISNGPIPKAPGTGHRGCVIRHSCDNTSCVNPDHLLSGTQGENLRDMSRRGRNSSRRKLDLRQAASARKMAHCGMSHKNIADFFEVPKHVIADAVSGKSYNECGEPAVHNGSRNLPRGEEHQRAMLSDNQVLSIRSRRRDGAKVADLANDYGCSKMHIYNIINHKKWKHLMGSDGK